jgi:hypothetical protein
VRWAVWIVLLTSAGCGSPGAPPPSTVVAPPPLASAPPATAVLLTSTATVAPPSLRAPVWPCEDGAAVDPAKVSDKIEGSFSRPGAHEMIGTMSCEPSGEGEAALILAVRDQGGVFRIARTDSIAMHSNIDRCQVLSTSTGRDLPICRRGMVSWGEVDEAVVVLDYTRDVEDEVVNLTGVIDTTDMACTGQTDLVIGKLESVELVDVDHDGNPDVRVTLRAARFHVPKQPPCQHRGFAGSGQAPAKVPHPPPLTIDFIAHGTVLTPTAAGARVLKMLEKLAPP